jgi:hypothetical protein
MGEKDNMSGVVVEEDLQEFQRSHSTSHRDLDELVLSRR